MRLFVLLVFVQFSCDRNAQAVAATATPSGLSAPALKQPEVSTSAADIPTRDHPGSPSDEEYGWFGPYPVTQSAEHGLIRAARVFHLTPYHGYHILPPLLTQHHFFIQDFTRVDTFIRSSFQDWIAFILQLYPDYVQALLVASATLRHVYGDEGVTARLEVALAARVPFAKELYELHLAWLKGQLPTRDLYNILGLNVYDKKSFGSSAMESWYAFAKSRHDAEEVQYWMLQRLPLNDAIYIADFLGSQETTPRSKALSLLLQDTLFKHYKFVNHWTPANYFEKLHLRSHPSMVDGMVNRAKLYSRYEKAYDYLKLNDNRLLRSLP